MRMLEKASPRVKVFSIGKTEEGREMIAVAISSETLIAKSRGQRRAPRETRRPAHASTLTTRRPTSSLPAVDAVYYITGTIHSPETGAPTALMELAYRLAVDENQYIKAIRDNMITLITPVVEVDGRDQMVDIYKWHLAHPGKNCPPLIYWGKYVAHDNNRDAMGVTLKLTRKRAQHLHAVARAGAARPARIRAVSLRQHRRRRPVQRLDRSDPCRRVADDRLAQRRRT